MSSTFNVEKFVGQFKPLSLILFALFTAIALWITYWSAKRVREVSHYYVAGARISGFVNGMAIAGDYMSAASFLGVAGLVSFFGLDGIYYAVGFLAGWILALVLAEAVRRAGRYTAGDIVTSTYAAKDVTIIVAIATICISVFYTIPQMVGAGSIAQALLGIPYELGVLIIGTLVIIIVATAGMVSTTFVQFVKAFLILAAGVILMISAWILLGNGSPIEFLSKFIGSEVSIVKAGKSVETTGIGFLSPGHRFPNPMDIISLSLALVLGTMSLPHILIRYLTVPNVVEARRSTLFAVLAIGTFYVATIFIGLAAAILDTRYYTNSNLSAPLLAAYVGSEPLFAYVSAVTFIVIVGTVAGLMMATAGALVRDLLVKSFNMRFESEKRELIIARGAAIAAGIFAMVMGILARGMNVAFLVGLAFAIASSSFLPGMIASLFLKNRVNSKIVALSMLVGLVSSIILILLSPTVMGKAAIFPLSNPGIVTIPLAFTVLGIGVVGKK